MVLYSPSYHSFSTIMWCLMVYYGTSGQTLVYSGAIFGVNVYFKTKLGNFESKVKDELASMQKQVKEGK